MRADPRDRSEGAPALRRLARAPARAYAWALRSEGSTRPAALLRIALALTLWARFAAEVAPFRARTGVEAAIGVAFYAASTLLLLGLHTRLAAVLCAGSVAAIYYGLGLSLGHTGLVHHHTYLLVVLSVLVALTPCGRSLSLDRWRALRRAAAGGRAPAPERANLWGMRLVGLQLALVYLAAAVDKCTPAFLAGERMEAILLWVYGDGPLRAIAAPGVARVAAWATVTLEFALGVGLFFAGARRWLIPAALAMHGLFYVVLPVATLSVTMAAMLLAAVDADAVHRGIDRLLGRDLERGCDRDEGR